MEKIANAPSTLEKVLGRVRARVYETLGVPVVRKIIPREKVDQVARSSWATYITDGPNDVVTLRYSDPSEGSYRRVLGQGEVKVAMID